MKKKFFVVAAVIISSHLHAQEEDTTAMSLDEVVMTANKYPTKTSLTGKVVTIITREQLDRSGGKDLSQILNEQAGVIINGANSNPGKDKSVFLRGARVEHTLITIDGIPVYDPSGIGGNFDIRNMAIDNIERIEILKGSQSTLYGSDAIAGVINIITKKPANNPLSANGVMSYGSNHTFRTSLGLSGISGEIDYSLSQSYFDSQGINEATTNNSTGDEDEYRQRNIQATVGIQVAEYLRVQPFIRYSQSIGDLDQGAFIDEPDFTFKQDNLQAGVRNEFIMGSSKLNLLYSFNDINRSYVDDSVRSNGFYTYSNSVYEGTEHFVDAFIFMPYRKMKFTTGIDFRSSSSRQESFTVPAFGPNPAILPRDSLRQKQGSLYAAVTINTDSGFSIEGGGRLNIHSEYGAKAVFNLNPTYIVNKKVKLFANLSSAYRTPSLYQLFSEFGNKKLEPESALTAEGGIQFFSPDKKLNARAVIFSRHVKNVIFFYFNPVTFQSQYINQDKQKDYGLELETAIKINKKTTLNAFYTYTDGKVTTKSGPNDTTYYNLLRRPKHSFGINAGSQLTDRIYISTNVLGYGERKDAYFDAQTFQTVYTTLKSYVLLDFYTEFSLLRKRLKLFIDLRNITNTKYTEISGFNSLGFNGNGGVRFTL